jgi:hypothetical protein
VSACVPTAKPLTVIGFLQALNSALSIAHSYDAGAALDVNVYVAVWLASKTVGPEIAVSG